MKILQIKERRFLTSLHTEFTFTAAKTADLYSRRTPTLRRQSLQLRLEKCGSDCLSSDKGHQIQTIELDLVTHSLSEAETETGSMSSEPHKEVIVQNPGKEGKTGNCK